MELPLIKAIEDHGPPISFSYHQVHASPDLFRERAALFYTATENLPAGWIGEGELDVTLPVVCPTFFECTEVRWYQTPRFWVDLLQRATGKLRWKAVDPAEVRVIRYDSVEVGYGEAVSGAKALLDALKGKTYGRPDGHALYYFGAIADDGPEHLLKYEFQIQSVAEPSLAKCRVIVKRYEGGSD
jgi:hypothetical protein